MKIFLVISSMNSGGAERVAATLCNAWAARGDDVSIIGMYSGVGECHYELGPSVRLVWIAERVGRARGRFRGYVARARALRRIVFEERPDVVVSFLANVNVTTLVALRGGSAPVIACERVDPGPKGGDSLALNLLRRVTYPWAAAVTVQTDAAAASLRRIVPSLARIEIVANPIPSEAMRTAGSSSDVPARRRIIGVGRLTEQKQFDHLIEAFAKVARRDPNLDLWIWGEGPLRNALRKQAMDAGLSERVFLPGKTGEPWAEMARAELLVMTSAYEGFPNALLEAMALGVPCISYDCPSGPREITDDGRLAVLVPLGDRDALVRAISSSLERPAERRASAQAAAKVVRERFSLPAVLRKWDTLFESVRRGIYVRSDNGPACDAKHH